MPARLQKFFGGRGKAGAGGGRSVPLVANQPLLWLLLLWFKGVFICNLQLFRAEEVGRAQKKLFFARAGHLCCAKLIATNPCKTTAHL